MASRPIWHPGMLHDVMHDCLSGALSAAIHSSPIGFAPSSALARPSKDSHSLLGASPAATLSAHRPRRYGTVELTGSRAGLSTGPSHEPLAVAFQKPRGA